MSEQIWRVIGLMSGTSMDGIDVAMIETDGLSIERLGPAGFYPYEPADRALIRKALDAATNLSDRSARPPVLAEAEAMVTHRHMCAIDSFLGTCQLDKSTVDLIGFHGQTIIHRPEKRLTVQIGNGAELAAHTGIPVIYDFRAADMAAGGQGAPLVPLFHQALVARAKLEGPVAVLNLGGIANVSYIDLESNELIACDTGPANALIDDFMLKRIGLPMDRNGEHASRGTVNEAILSTLMANQFFEVSPPKSLDRNTFSLPDLSALSTEDGAATLTAFTARSVAKIIPHFPQAPSLWVLCGGGARNPELVRQISACVDAKTLIADEMGWSTDAMEAQAFAFLAVRSSRELPLTLPTTTGVHQLITGGVRADPVASSAK